MYLTKLCHALFATTIASALFASGCASGSGDDGTDSGTGAATSTTTPAALSREYQGTIKDLKIVVRLDVQGSNVSGSYFYADKPGNGDVITLKGTIAGNQLKLDESVKGQKTGQMAATVSGTKLSGTWAKPDGTGKLTLALDAIPTNKLLPITRKLAQSFKATSSEGGNCVLASEYVEIYGMADAKAEAAINGVLVTKPIDSKCDFAFSETLNDLVTFNDSGILVVVQTEEDDGGAHPNSGHTAFNFDLTTGKQLGPKEILKPDAMPKVKELVLANLPDDLKPAKDDISQQLDEVQLEDVDLEVTKSGLQTDFFNAFPHAILDEAPDVILKWADVKDLLQPGTAVAKLATQ
jgi:hypothetical protein